MYITTGHTTVRTVVLGSRDAGTVHVARQLSTARAYVTILIEVGIPTRAGRGASAPHAALDAWCAGLRRTSP